MIARLLAEPHRFGFFQAVRLLERWLRPAERPGRTDAGIGRIRFRNSLELGFPPSEIARLTVVAKPQVDPGRPPAGPPFEGGAVGAAATARPAYAADSGAGVGLRADDIESIELTPAFMGLLGAGSTLPIRYTELLAERETYHRDTAARAFLDIFQHRAVSLFYQAWRKHRLPVQYEADRSRHFMPHVLALAGLGQSGLRGRLQAEAGGLADDTLAYFAGALQHRPVSAATVRQMVAQHFGVGVHLEPFVGRWFTLPAGSETSLGIAQAELGIRALVGTRVWQRDLRMRLTLGPMPHAQFRRFLPGGSGQRALLELLTLLTGVSLEYEIRLTLRAADVQGTTLRPDHGAAADPPMDGAPEALDGPVPSRGALLGWDTFLVTQPVLHDREDAGYDIHALA